MMNTTVIQKDDERKDTRSIKVENVNVTIKIDRNKISRNMARFLFAVYFILTVLIIVMHINHVVECQKEEQITGRMDLKGLLLGISATAVLLSVLFTRRFTRWRCNETYYRTVYFILIILLFAVSFLSGFYQRPELFFMTSLYYLLCGTLVSALYGRSFDSFLFASLFIVVVVGSVVGYYESCIIGKEIVEEILG